jgi:hypothetical protein
MEGSATFQETHTLLPVSFAIRGMFCEVWKNFPD